MSMSHAAGPHAQAAAIPYGSKTKPVPFSTVKQAGPDLSTCYHEVVPVASAIMSPVGFSGLEEHRRQGGAPWARRYGFPMCLAVPGKITELHDERGVPMARVDFAGISREVCMAYLPEARPGEYVVVHVGFAISQVDEEEAARTLADLRELGALAELEE